MSRITHVKSEVEDVIVEYSHFKGFALKGKKDWSGTIPEGGELIANWKIGEEDGYVTFQAILDYEPIDSWISFDGIEKYDKTFAIIKNGYEITFGKKKGPNFLWTVTAKPINSEDNRSSQNPLVTQTDIDIEIGPKVN